MGDAVITAAILNFCTQCEMVIFYADCILARLSERSSDLSTAMKVSILYYFTRHINFIRHVSVHKFPVKYKFFGMLKF